MSHPTTAVKSLAVLRFGRRRIYFLPWRSLLYGLFSLALVLAIAALVDRHVLGSLERAGWTAGELWARHNRLIEDNHRRKTTTNECELRHWSGQPLPPASAQRRKILVLGDSFVWGPPYITINHLWWRQLAIEIERRGYGQVDVVAVGHPGWSTHRQLQCAEQLFPSVRPDLIIWGYVTNDPDEKLVPQIFDSQDQPPYGQRVRQQLKRWLPNLTFKFESLRADKLASQYAGPAYGYAYPDWELKLLEGENFARYRQTVSQVGAFLKQAQVPAFLQTLPHFPSREYFGPRYSPVLKEWQAAGVPVNDTLDEFLRRYGNVAPTGPEALAFGINPGDSHPGPRATHFAAVMAADYVERHWPAVLGPKDPLPSHELAINDWLPSDLQVRQTGKQSFRLEYPSATDAMPRLPLDEPTALLALRYPLPIREIRLAGAALSGARIWVSLLDARDQFDDVQWHDLGRFTGSTIDCRLPDDLARRELAEIRFHANFAGSNRNLTLSLAGPGSAAEGP